MIAAQILQLSSGAITSNFKYKSTSTLCSCICRWGCGIYSYSSQHFTCVIWRCNRTQLTKRSTAGNTCHPHCPQYVKATTTLSTRRVRVSNSLKPVHRSIFLFCASLQPEELLGGAILSRRAPAGCELPLHQQEQRH